MAVGHAEHRDASRLLTGMETRRAAQGDITHGCAGFGIICWPKCRQAVYAVSRRPLGHCQGVSGREEAGHTASRYRI